ncbi:putative serine carboxypeptidase-like 48-like [Capsicum annuum]|nr:putative serine carboxypeptidase-like 48-like [Capsicum annuum]
MNPQTSNNNNNQTNPRKRPFQEQEPNNEKQPVTLNTMLVAIDHNSLFYTVCSTCEANLPDPLPNSSSSSIPLCKNCNFNPASSGSKRLFRVLVSIATEKRVVVVIMFDRVARVLFGCSADEFFDFAKTHPCAAAAAGKALEGEMLKVTVSQPKNGNARHLRVVSVLPLRTGFRPVIETLRELYRARGGS